MGLAVLNVAPMLCLNVSVELYGQASSSVLATQVPHLHDRVSDERDVPCMNVVMAHACV